MTSKMFIGLAREGLKNAGFWLDMKLYSNLLVLATALTTNLVSSAVAYFLSVLALVGAALNIFCLLKHREWLVLGREALRKGMLLDALDQGTGALDLADLQQRFGEAATAEARKFDEKYYESEAPKGFSRLRDHIQESAFFSKHLFRCAAKREFVKFGFITLAFFVVLLLIPVTGITENILLFLNGIIAFIVFYLGLESLNDALAWNSSDRTADSIDRRLDKQSPSNEEIVAAFVDYQSLIAITPLFPATLYQSNRDRLNELWRQRKDHSTETKNNG